MVGGYGLTYAKHIAQCLAYNVFSLYFNISIVPTAWLSAHLIICLKKQQQKENKCLWSCMCLLWDKISTYKYLA